MVQIAVRNLQDFALYALHYDICQNFLKSEQKHQRLKSQLPHLANSSEMLVQDFKFARF